MVAIDKKNKKGQQPQKKFNKDKKALSGQPDKNSDSKSPYEAQNDKLREAIMALGGTKGDVKYLENIDIEDNDKMVTGDDVKTEVCLAITKRSTVQLTPSILGITPKRIDELHDQHWFVC